MHQIFLAQQHHVASHYPIQQNFQTAGLFQVCQAFLGPQQMASPLGSGAFNQFSMMLMNQLLMNFMQGSMHQGCHCPRASDTGLYQPYRNLPYGPREQAPLRPTHQHRAHQRYNKPANEILQEDPRRTNSKLASQPSPQGRHHQAVTKSVPPTRSRSYDPTKDAGALEKAMNGGMLGLGTDEEAILKTLRGKSREEITLLKQNYRDHYGKDLEQQLKKDLNRKEYAQVQDLMKGNTAKADARKLRAATSGLGDDEKAIFETLRGKSQEERQSLLKEYKQLTGRDLDVTLKSRLSKSEYQQASGLLQGSNAKADAAKLHDALSGLGDDEASVYQTLRGKSADERAAIQKEYKALTGQELSTRIKSRLDKTEQNQALGLLEGNSAQADAAALKDAMSGLGTDEKAIFSVLEGKSAEERAKIAQAYKKEYGVDLKQRLSQDMKGNDLDKASTLLEKGGLSDSQKLRHAMEGIGTDESSIKHVLEGKTREEIAQIRQDYKRETGRELDRDLKSELGGRDQFEAFQALKGKPTSIDEAVQRMNERHAFERKGLGNKISNSVMDAVNDKGELLDTNHQRANEQYEVYKKALSEGRTADAQAAKGRLGQLLGYTDLDVSSYQESKDAVADTAGTVAATAAATAVIVGTAGTGTPLVATALAAAGAGAGARTVTTTAISGKGYDVQNLATDAAVGAVDGASTVLGMGAGRAAASGYAAARGAAGGGSKVTRLAMEGAVDGAIGGGVGGGAAEALRDGTWSDGLGEGLKRVGTAGGLGATAGSIAGGGIAGLGGAAPSLARGGKEALEAVGEMGEKSRAFTRDLGDKGRQVLGDLGAQGRQVVSDIGAQGRRTVSDLGDAGRRLLDGYKELDAKAQSALRKAFDSGDQSSLTGKARDFYQRAKESGRLSELKEKIGTSSLDGARAKIDDVQAKLTQEPKRTVEPETTARTKLEVDTPEIRLRNQIENFPNRKVHDLLSGSSKFRELSPTEQLDLLKMADRHKPDENFFSRLFSKEKPSSIQQNLRKLLDSGHMSKKGLEGETLLKNLQDLENAPMARGLSSKEIFRETVDTVANPGRIAQKNRGTCSAATVQYIHAKTDPSDYVRVMKGLAEESGQARLRSGKIMKRNETGLAVDDSGRRHTDRLYQSSAMDHANEGKLRYDNKVDGHLDQSGKKVHGGLGTTQEGVLTRDVLGERPVELPREVDTPEVRRLFRERLTRQMAETGEDFHIAMRWADKGDGMHSYHAVSAYRMDDQYVYIRNPWGKGDTGGGSGAVREMLDKEGRARVTHDEFFGRLSSYRYQVVTEVDKTRASLNKAQRTLSREEVPMGQDWLSEEFLRPRVQKLFPDLDISKVPQERRIDFYMQVSNALHNSSRTTNASLEPLSFVFKRFDLEYDPTGAVKSWG